MVQSPGHWPGLFQLKCFRAGSDLQNARGKNARHHTTIRLAPVGYLIVMLTGVEAMPFATTSSWLAPRSIFGGTRKVVVTTVEPVATPMELGL